MTPQRHILLGLFCVAVVAVLSYFTLFKTDFPLLGERTRMTVFFDDASGLRQGDSVLVAGMRWGQIDNLAYHPERALERRVTVELTLTSPVVVYQDHRIAIEDATVLGGKQLSIEPGTRDSGAVPPGFVYMGIVAGGPLDALGDIVTENRDSLRNVMTGLEQLVEDLRSEGGVIGRLMYDKQLSDNLSKAVTSISATFENAEYLTTELSQGKGTLGKLFSSDELYPKIVQAVDDLDALLTDVRAAVTDAREGRGTLGLLLADEPTRDRVSATLERIEGMVASIERGDGTIGRFFKDDTFARNLETFSESLVSGEGTLARLLEDRTLYDNAVTISEDLKAFSASLNSTDGSLGRLVNDPALYEELERALATLTGSLEEAREAAPISTFLSALFLGF